MVAVDPHAPTPPVGAPHRTHLPAHDEDDLDRLARLRRLDEPSIHAGDVHVLSVHGSVVPRDGACPERHRAFPGTLIDRRLIGGPAPPAADLDGRRTTLAGADADHFLHRGDEYLSVSDGTCFPGINDCIYAALY